MKNRAKNVRTIKRATRPEVSPLGGRAFRSTDDGVTWVGANKGTDSSIICIAINSRQHLFAATFRMVNPVRAGVFRSTDSGESWIRTTDGLPAEAVVFDLLVNVSDVVFAGTSRGVSRSTDTGLQLQVFNYRLQAGSFVETKNLLIVR